MGPNTKAALFRLAEREPGKGIPLDGPMKRAARRAIGDGLVEEWGFGSFSVFIITEAGRASLPTHSEL